MLNILDWGISDFDPLHAECECACICRHDPPNESKDTGRNNKLANRE